MQKFKLLLSDVCLLYLIFAMFSLTNNAIAAVGDCSDLRCAGDPGGSHGCNSNEYYIDSCCKACPGGSLCNGNIIVRQSSCGTYIYSCGSSVDSDYSATQCPVNTYCPTGSREPTSCPSGYRSPAGSCAASDCVLCTSTCGAGYNVWTSYDTSHEVYKKCECTCSGNTDSCSNGTSAQWQYRCKSGYYGAVSTGSPGTCTQCPKIPNLASNPYGTSIAGNNFAIASCFATANTNYGETIGTFQFTQQCNYSN